jgi:hypothetical protein
MNEGGLRAAGLKYSTSLTLCTAVGFIEDGRRPAMIQDAFRKHNKVTVHPYYAKLLFRVLSLYSSKMELTSPVR